MPSASLRGCHELLGLTNGCTELEIKSAYKRLAVLHHPDKNRGSKRSEESFKPGCLPLLPSHMINNAYETLMNAASRADCAAKPQPQPQSSQQRSQSDCSAKPKAQPRSSHQQSHQQSSRPQQQNSQQQRSQRRSQQQNSQQRRQPRGDSRGKKRNRPLYPRGVDFHTENTLIEHAQQVRRNWERRGILLTQNSEAERTELKMLIERNVEVVNRVRLVTQSPYAPLEDTGDNGAVERAVGCEDADAGADALDERDYGSGGSGKWFVWIRA